MEISDARIAQLRRDIEAEERAGNRQAARILRQKMRALLVGRRSRTYIERAIGHYQEDVKGGK
jgi:hypothetical protein